MDPKQLAKYAASKQAFSVSDAQSQLKRQLAQEGMRDILSTALLGAGIAGSLRGGQGLLNMLTRNNAPLRTRSGVSPLEIPVPREDEDDDKEAKDNQADDPHADGSDPYRWVYRGKGDGSDPENWEYLPPQKKKKQKKEAGQRGLWDNVHAKRKRGEKPAKKGDKDYPDSKSWKKVTKESAQKEAKDLQQIKSVKPGKGVNSLQDRDVARRGYGKDLLRQQLGIEGRPTPSTYQGTNRKLAFELAPVAPPVSATGQRARFGSPGDLNKQGFAPVPDSVTKKDSLWWYMPSMLAAGLGGGYGGWKLVDKIMDSRRQTEVQDELEAAKADYEDALQSHLKAGSDSEIGNALDSLYDKMEKVSFSLTPSANTMGSLGGAYATYAIPSALLGYLVVKNLTDKGSKRKVLQKAQENRAARRQKSRPSELYAIPDPVEELDEE